MYDTHANAHLDRCRRTTLIMCAPIRSDAEQILSKQVLPQPWDHASNSVQVTSGGKGGIAEFRHPPLPDLATTKHTQHQHTCLTYRAHPHPPTHTFRSRWMTFFLWQWDSACATSSTYRAPLASLKRPFCSVLYSSPPGANSRIR